MTRLIKLIRHDEKIKRSTDTRIDFNNEVDFLMGFDSKKRYRYIQNHRIIVSGNTVIKFSRVLEVITSTFIIIK